MFQPDVLPDVFSYFLEQHVFTVSVTYWAASHIHSLDSISTACQVNTFSTGIFLGSTDMTYNDDDDDKNAVLIS